MSQLIVASVYDDSLRFCNNIDLMSACMKITRERRAIEIILAGGNGTDLYH